MIYRFTCWILIATSCAAGALDSFEKDATKEKENSNPSPSNNITPGYFHDDDDDGDSIVGSILGDIFIETFGRAIGFAFLETGSAILTSRANSINRVAGQYSR